MYQYIRVIESFDDLLHNPVQSLSAIYANYLGI